MYVNGIDIIEIERIEEAVKCLGERFLRRIYTEAELKTCLNKMPQLACYFAAKEAVMKALGTGTKGISWHEIEISHDTQGKPLIRLRGRAEEKARELGISGLSLSLSHSKEYAIASVIGSRTKEVS